MVQSHINNDYTNNSSKNTTFLAYNGVATLIDYIPDDHLINEFRFYDLDFREIVASCNGFVQFLVRNSSRPYSWLDTLRLVNPITRRCLVLHEEMYTFPWPDLDCGLGYGSKTGLLKVVRLGYRHGLSAKITAEVMTVRDEGDCAWKVMDTELFGFTSIRSKPVVLNGALHWLVDCDNLILRFDIDKEKFDFISSPCTSNTPSEINRRRR
uniref:F-box associated beta-propeller type 3 domain-containing protein n=1 Tax=Chenopodium quinoa TaxID=63459 RepID=A0A803KUD9_CHEQI